MIGKSISHYRVTAKLGAGGMGEVYRAHDERLDRDVALKVLPAGLLADESARKRFRKEALMLSKLNHPNIATVHDFDTEDGVDFLVMEYVAGTTLAEKLAGRALPEKEVARLGTQMAAALEEAHERGVIHRDLKPSNVMVTPKGQTKVLDFGLAKLVRPVSETAVTESLTEAPAAAGTFPYMAPEQLRGKTVDARTDLHALGVLLYEMATGQRPFPEARGPRLIDAILNTAPVPPSRFQPRLSTELERIILKCLEKDPENRYQSAKEIGVDLRRLGSSTSVSAVREPIASRIPWRRAVLASVSVVAFLAVLFALNVGGLRERLRAPAAMAPIKSLAVLPLDNISGDPEQEYFADGMTDALIAELGQISALRVISRQSSMRYKGSDMPLPEIARELNVDAVVEGSVLHSGERVRVTAQLIGATPERHLWAESYERDLGNVLALHSEVAQAIARKIEIAVTPEEQTRLARVRPVNPEAHEAYLKGQYYLNMGVHDERFNKAIDYFNEAIEKDPAYALAYAGLAEAYARLGVYRPPKEFFPKAKAAAMKALELDDTLSEAHTSVAVARAFYDWDWAAAERGFKRAIELNPSSASAHVWYGDMLGALGRLDESLAETKRGHELDPVSWLTNAELGKNSSTQANTTRR